MMYDNVKELSKDELDILMAYSILSNCCKRGLISKSSLEKIRTDCTERIGDTAINKRGTRNILHSKQKSVII